MKRAAVILAMGILMLSHVKAYAWNDEKTHPRITQWAIDNSNLKQYLENQLHIPEGIDKEVEGKSLLKWSRYGSCMEDDPACRAMNHFHNPYKKWNEAGLSDIWYPMVPWCPLVDDYSTKDIRSSLIWATGCLDEECSEKDEITQDKNEWYWQTAKYYYYVYLTGQDYYNLPLAWDRKSREIYLAAAMRALGQVMHLLQDSAVPAHVRDDFSRGHLMVSPKNLYPYNDLEKFVALHDKELDSLLAPPYAVKSGMSGMYLTDFWDKRQLFNGDVTATPMGLAEYTTMNFISEGSMFASDFDYPKEEDCQIWADNSPYTGTTSRRLYVKTLASHPGEQTEHLAVLSFWHYWRDFHIDLISNPWRRITERLFDLYYMDEACHMDYITKLIPRAAGYSSDLLDYFFRGQMTVKALPVFKDGALNFIRLTIKNTTPTQEAMLSGDSGGFLLSLGYTPENAPADGTEDLFFTFWAGSRPDLPFDQEVDVYFYPEPDSPQIPVDHWATVKATLTYFGTLGDEQEAVIAKAFEPGGKIRFNEDWDGPTLTANNAWEFEADRNDAEFVSSKRIENGRLIMTLHENSGAKGGGSNEIWYDFTDNPEGLLITQNTVIQMAVEEMSSLPDGSSPGAFAHDIQFTFNAGPEYGGISDHYRILYTIDGPYRPNLYPLPEVSEVAALKILTPYVGGNILAEDIYGAFERSGITIPEPLYLKNIQIFQKITSSSVEVKNSMRTVIDQISIFEMKAE